MSLHQTTSQLIPFTSICKHMISALLYSTFQGVGLQNAKRMAPKNTQKQTMHILDSFVKSAFTQKYNKQNQYFSQLDPSPACIDNLAVMQVIEEQNKTIKLENNNDNTNANQSRHHNSSKQRTQRSLRSRKITISQLTQKQSVKSRQKSRLNTKNSVNQLFKKLNLPQEEQNLKYQNDQEINKIRQKYLKYQKEEILEKQKLKIKLEQSQLEKDKKIKQIKNIKKYTYDYQGKLFNQGTGISQPQKLLTLNKKYSQNNKIIPKNRQIQTSNVQLTSSLNKSNLNIKQKSIKQASIIFRQQAQSIIQHIESHKGISNGVKITQELSKNKTIIKENRSNKQQNMSFNSLRQFKQNNQTTKFKQFVVHKKISNFKTLNYVNNEEEYQNYEKNNMNKQRVQSNYDLLEGKSKMTINPLLNKINNNNNNSINNNNKQKKSLSTYSLLDIGNKKQKSHFILDSERCSSINYNQNPISSALIQPNTIHPNLISLKQSSRRPKQFYQYKGLPFIKSKGYKMIDFSSEKSFKLKESNISQMNNGNNNGNYINSNINSNKDSGIIKNKNKININHYEFFQNTIEQN